MKRDYGRTTITVPWELKARMKKARSQVNWSAVACEAFEQKLEELGPIEEIDSIEEAVKRMKALQEDCQSAKQGASQSGHEAGVHWAMNFARPGQLRRIAKFRSEHTDGQWESKMSSREGWRELGECIQPNNSSGHRPRPDHQRGPQDEGEFEDSDAPRGRHRRRRGPDRHEERPMHPERHIWRAILDRRPDHPGFFLGFANGALEVWEKIKDQFNH